MFKSKNKKKICIPILTPVLLYKSGVYGGIKTHGHVILKNCNVYSLYQNTQYIVCNEDMIN